MAEGDVIGVEVMLIELEGSVGAVVVSIGTIASGLHIAMRKRSLMIVSGYGYDVVGEGREIEHIFGVVYRTVVVYVDAVNVLLD